MASAQELADYMTKHVHYEVEMLCFTYSQLFDDELRKRADDDAHARLTFNAYYESFAAHSRLLRGFLYGNDGDNLKASEYAEGFGPNDKDEPEKFFTQHVNFQVFHLAKNRVSEGKPKVTFDHVAKAYWWLTTNLTTFGKSLPEKPEGYRNAWAEIEKLIAAVPAKPVGPKAKDVLQASMTASPSASPSFIYGNLASPKKKPSEAS